VYSLDISLSLPSQQTFWLDNAKDFIGLLQISLLYEWAGVHQAGLGFQSLVNHYVKKHANNPGHHLPRKRDASVN
jgi:hypothetical protein